MHKLLHSILPASLLLASLTMVYAQTRPHQPTPTLSKPMVTPAPSPQTDLLVRRDGTQLEVLVTEITDNEIVYKLANNLSSTIYRGLKSNFSYVKYGFDGHIEEFSQAITPSSAAVAAPVVTSAVSSRPTTQPIAPSTTPNRTLAFQKGDKIFTAGIDIEKNYTPVGINLEYALNDGLGLLGGVGYASIVGISVWSVGVGLMGHLGKAFGIQDGKTDPYIGFGIAKGFASDGYGNSAQTDIIGTGSIGLRYYLTDRIGIYGDLSLGIVNASGSSFGLGVAVRLR